MCIEEWTLVFGRYFVFIALIVVITVVAGISIKLEKIDMQNINVTSDPVKGLKNYYADLIWKSLPQKTDPKLRFATINRVIEYNPDFKPAYLELCNSYSDYIKNNNSVRDFIRTLKDAVERFGSTDFLECYTGSMILLGKYIDAIDFLEKEKAQATDNQKEVFGSKIKSLKNEKNMLDLTKAMEAFFQKNKTYPGDILVLVVEGYIETIPDDPYGGQYFIGDQGQIMSTSTRRQ